jgi:hypothetical protein
MSSSPFLPLPTGLEIATIEAVDDLPVGGSGGFDEREIFLSVMFLSC